MKNLILSSVFALIASSAVKAQEAVQWRVQDGGNGHWYQFMPVGSYGSWSSASDAASQYGGHLATLTTAAELAFIEGLVACVGCPGYGPSWAIGGFQDKTSPSYAEPTGGWKWITGEPWAFAPWALGEPNDLGGTEDLLYLVCNFHGFNDGGDPSNGCIAAVFEWSADCNNDGIIDYGQILDGTFPDANGNGVPDCCDGGESCTPCPGDVVRDELVDGVDLAAVLSQWATQGSGAFNADIDGSGLVDGGDLALVLGGWGPCPQ